MRPIGVSGPTRVRISFSCALIMALVPSRPAWRCWLLSRFLLISSSAVTKQVDRLIARGLVKRCPDPDTPKSSRVKLTPAGRRVADAALHEIMKSFALAAAIKELFADLRAGGLEFLRALSIGMRER